MISTEDIINTAFACGYIIRREEASSTLFFEDAATGKVKINITAGSVGLTEDKVVGPLDITGKDTVRDLEDKIKSWLTEEDIEFDAGERGFLQLGFEGELLGGDTVVLDIPGGGELSVLPPKEEGRGEGADGGGA